MRRAGRSTSAVAKSRPKHPRAKARPSRTMVARSRRRSASTPVRKAVARLGFSAFQEEAEKTSHLSLGGPQDAVAPMLGLASETGSILDVYKKYLRDQIDLDSQRELLKEEIGDLLWYAAAVATSFDLRLDEIASATLERTRDRYLPPDAAILATLPRFDAEYPRSERFPRKLVVQYAERRKLGRTVASARLVSAKPNAFPSGPTLVDGEMRGYALNARLGDPLTDNSSANDGYRYHDAIHFGFLAVLGWSPILRKLLGVRRWSNAAINECEDGARARYTEEGLSAVLTSLSVRRIGFKTERSVDGDAIGTAIAVTRNLEVKKVPAWLWRSAIGQGFAAMHNLIENKGGSLVADLDARTLSYRKLY